MNYYDDPQCLALFKNVRANPTQDLAKNALADWLQDYDEYAWRARLIQMTMRPQSRNWFGSVSFSSHNGFVLHVSALQYKNCGADFRRLYKTVLDDYDCRISVHQGFIHWAELTWEEWRRHADALIRESCGLRVTLTRLPYYVQKTIRNGDIQLPDEKIYRTPTSDPDASTLHDLGSVLHQRWPDVKSWAYSGLEHQNGQSVALYPRPAIPV